MAQIPKILILSSEYKPVLGGIGTYARELGVAAAHLGAEVVLLAPDYNGQAGPDENEGGLHIRRYRGGKHYYAHLPQKFRLTHAAVSKARFDIVNAVDWPFYIPVASLSRKHAAVRLATLHGTEINQMADPKRKLLLKMFRIMPRFDGLLCNSNFTQTLYRKHFGNSLDCSRVTLLGVSNIWHEEEINDPHLKMRV